MERYFIALGHFIQKRIGWLLAAILLITAGFAVGLPKVQMDMGNSIFVSKKAQVYKDTETYQKHFGGDAVYVLLSGSRDDLVSHDTMNRLDSLRSRLDKVDNVRGTTSIVNVLDESLHAKNAASAGNASQAQQAQMMASLPAKSKQQLQGQLTAMLTADQQQQIQQFTMGLLNDDQKQALMANPAAAGQMTSALNSSQQAKIQQYTMTLLTSAQKEQLSQQVQQQLPNTADMSTKMLRSLIFSDNGRVPKAMQQLLPKNGRNLLLLVNTSDKTDMTTYVKLTKDVNQAIKAAHFGHNVKVRVAGSPAISGQVQARVTRAMMIMLGLAVVVMFVILSLIFRVRRRMFPLFFVAVSLIWTFGFMGWTGISLTLATMATLPIIIGLGTDFGVQFLNRYEEEYRHEHNATRALEVAIGKMGPAVGISLMVMTFSFLTMFLSKAPMMQGFGLTLAIGVVSAYITELILMFSIVPFLDRNSETKAVTTKEQQPSVLAALLKRYATFVTKHSVVILIIGVLLGGIGFGVERQLNTETDMTKMIPQSMPALQNTKYLQRQIGSTAYITYLVKADDVRDQKTMQYVAKFGRQENQRYTGITGVTSLPTSLQLTATKVANTPQNNLNASTNQLPKSMKQVLISNDHQYTTLQFRINKDLSSTQQLKLMNQISNDVHAPHGVSIRPAGAQVMGLTGVNNMTANHELIIIAGITIIFLILLLIYRDFRFALYPVLPILLVLGLSPLTLWLMGISYNPLTISLSSLVLGIGTEFTILILERYREEQQRGKQPVEAIIEAVTSVGQAIFVSGMTVIGGFSAIIFANFPVLQSFGLITVLDTAFSLISALTILPAIIVFLHRWDRKKTN